MTNQNGDGPKSGPPGSTPEERAAAFQKKIANLTAENQTPRRDAVDPLAYSNAGMAQTQIDAVRHDKIIQQRAQQKAHQSGQQQKSPELKPRDEAAMPDQAPRKSQMHHTGNEAKGVSRTAIAI